MVDVISSPAIVAAPEEDITVAVRRMRDHHVGSLPVVEGRRLLGILTETDLLRRITDADAETEIEVTGFVVSYP